MNRNQTIWLIAGAFVLVICLVVGLSLMFENCLTAKPDPADTDRTYSGENRVTIDGRTYLRRNITTYLLIGLDTEGKLENNGSFRNEQQADFLMLLIADHDAGTWKMLHINRDTITPVKTLDIFCRETGRTENMQIALSHTYGSGTMQSCQLTADAVSGLLCGVRIDRYMAVTMGAVPFLTDITGPITVTVPGDMTAIHPSWTEGAVVSLEGQQALDFVQARQGAEDQTNISRMRRQQIFAEALIGNLSDVLGSKTDTEIYRSYQTYLDYTCTNAPISDTISLLRQTRQYTYAGTVTPEGTSKIGSLYGEPVMEFYADSESLKQMVISLMLKEENGG